MTRVDIIRIRQMVSFWEGWFGQLKDFIEEFSHILKLWIYWDAKRYLRQKDPMYWEGCFVVCWFIMEIQTRPLSIIAAAKR